VAREVGPEAPVSHGLKVALRVLRAEGARAVCDRLLDRLAEDRRRRSFAASLPGHLSIAVLDIAAAPPAARLGGVQAQLLHRIEAESALRPLALLHPEDDSYRLEVIAERIRGALRLPGREAPHPLALEDAGFERAVETAAGKIGAAALHVEGLAGQPLSSLLALHRRGLRLILSLHDFSPFCPRPHLLEHPTLHFCHYSTDMDRCAACLRQDWPLDGAWQARRRELAAALLAAADALVFPSDFLRHAYRDLFPGLDPARQRVIEPATAWDPVPPRAASTGPIRHVALVGGVQVHKGALVFEEVVRCLADQDLRWSAYGGGDAEILGRLRRLPRMSIRGYYRSGALPRLLRRDRVDLALLLSIVPETYSLVLTECHAAGVPVLAFDLGAPGDRLRMEGGGLPVDPEAGAAGIASLLHTVEAGRTVLPSLVAFPESNARRVAESWRRLYAESGL
jgi:glycosyltransferase involved in cell wall biosynthesis